MTSEDNFEINLDDIIIDGTSLEDINADTKTAELNILNTNETELRKEQKKAVEKTMKQHYIDNPFSEITSTQAVAIDLFLQGKNKTQIAKEIGVSKPTIYNWFKNDEFLTVLDKVKNEIDIANKNRFQSLVGVALDELKKILYAELGDLKEGKVDSRTKLGAIKMVLEGSKTIQPNNSMTTSTNQTQIIINSQFKNDDVREVDLSESNIIDVEEEAKE